jgi:hypothetical protein
MRRLAIVLAIVGLAALGVPPAHATTVASFSGAGTATRTGTFFCQERMVGTLALAGGQWALQTTPFESASSNLILCGGAPTGFGVATDAAFTSLTGTWSNASDCSQSGTVVTCQNPFDGFTLDLATGQFRYATTPAWSISGDLYSFEATLTGASA